MTDRLALVVTSAQQRANGTTGDAPHVACAHAHVRLRAEGDRAWWCCEACGAPFAPAILAPRPVDVAPGPEYLSVRQLAERIPYTEGAIRNLMSRGVLRLGTHYTKPHGRPIFEWAAVVEWLKDRDA